MTVKELEFDAQHFIEVHTAMVDVIVATATAIELAEGAFSVTRIAGPTGAIESCSATTSRRGQRTAAARRTGRRQEKLSSDRAATRLRHSVESFGVMGFSPKRASSVVPIASSPGRPAPGK
jgi:hypothetical protein